MMNMSPAVLDVCLLQDDFYIPFSKGLYWPCPYDCKSLVFVVKCFSYHQTTDTLISKFFLWRSKQLSWMVRGKKRGSFVMRFAGETERINSLTLD
jgi:hypothetical protein